MSRRTPAGNIHRNTPYQLALERDVRLFEGGEVSSRCSVWFYTIAELRATGAVTSTLVRASIRSLHSRSDGHRRLTGNHRRQRVFLQT